MKIVELEIVEFKYNAGEFLEDLTGEKSEISLHFGFFSWVLGGYVGGEYGFGIFLAFGHLLN
jgi:hypothetical protein